VLDVLEVQDTIAKRTWAYDKTEDPAALLDPMFWTKFDYVLAERPEKVIGSWAIVHVEYGFGGIRVLKPGEKSESPAEVTYGTADSVRVQEDWTSKVAAVWRKAEGLLRDRVLRGYWAEVRMEPKIRILQNQAK
jgi:alpha-1,6-mannosyltransferase